MSPIAAMDDEVSTAIDAEVDAQLRPRSTTSRHRDREGVIGGTSKDTAPLRDHEETPLLPQLNTALGPDGQAPEDQNAGPEDSESTPVWRRASVFWLVPFLLLYMLSFGGPVVPKINLMISMVCREYMQHRASNDPGFTYLPVIVGQDNPQCQIPEVQSLVSRFQLVFNLIAGILSALVSPRMGHLSDRYGRTHIIALSVLGTLFAEANILFVAANQESLPVNMLLLSAILEGFGGSFTAMLALTSSYASDCTKPEKRSVAFGYIYGSIFIGVAAGPLLVAILIKNTGTILSVFYASVVLNVLFLLVVLFVLPESLSRERQHAAREKRRLKHAHKEKVGWFAFKRWNPMKIFTPLSILLPPVGRPSTLFPYPSGASTTIRRNILLLCGVDTVMFGLSMGAAQIVIIYAEYIFGWGNVESSLYISLVCFVRVLNLFVVLPALTWLFRKQPRNDHEIPGSDNLEIVLIRASVLLEVLGYAGFAMATNSPLMLLSGVVAAFGGLGSPTLQSSLTKHVPHDRIGQILGAKGLLHALSRVIAPTACSLIYSVTVASYPPAVFVCLAGVLTLVLGCSFFIVPHASLAGNHAHYGDAEANEDGEEADEALLRPEASDED